jgi:dipeptidyl aminopeptidase/acylaminoacyl peptidase
MKNRHLALVIVASLLGLSVMTNAGGAVSPGGAAASAPARYEAKIFYETTSYQLAQARAWSYDQKELLISSDESSITNAYALSAVDGRRRQLSTSTTQPIYAISWFPHDGRALLQADQSGNEMTHIFVRETSGEMRDVTPGEKTKADFIDWAADGNSFFVLSNERDPQAFDVYRIDANTYTRTLLYRNEALLEIAAISPQGRYVAGLKHSSNVDSDIYVADLNDKNGTAKLITQHQGAVSFGVYQFTHDGEHLVYSTNGNGEFDEAWTYDFKTQQSSPLIQAQWDVSFVAFSESGRYRVSGLNQDARTTIAIADQKGKAVKLPGLPPGDLARIRFSPDDTKVALLSSSDTSPNDVYVVDLKKQQAKRMTHALSSHITESDLVASEVIRYRSFDGVEIPAVLYRPKAASKSSPVPALVWVHGGPGGQSRTGYTPDVQFFVDHG